MTHQQETAVRARMVQLDQASDTLWGSLQHCVDLQVDTQQNPYDDDNYLTKTRVIISRALKAVADEWVALRSQLKAKAFATERRTV